VIKSYFLYLIRYIPAWKFPLVLDFERLLKIFDFNEFLPLELDLSDGIKNLESVALPPFFAGLP